MTLFQRGPDGYPVNADPLMREAYGRIPGCSRFQSPRDGWQVPTEIHGWQFSETFRRWSALVTFENGWHGWAFPEHAKDHGDRC
jgi:hypothetical protein